MVSSHKNWKISHRAFSIPFSRKAWFLVVPVGEILLLAFAMEWQGNSGLGPQTLISIAKEVCSYFLCKAVWATWLNSSRHVCRGGGCRGGSNQVASLWQPRCNSNSRQCKKVSGWLGWQTRTDIKNFTILLREPSYTIISVWLWKNQKVGSNHQH